MADEKLSSSLQESILTAICFADDKGAVIAGLVTPDLFEGSYRDIATRALEFRKRFGKAPGAAHIDDLFDHILEDPSNKKAETYKRLLSGMLRQQDGLNVEFVLTRVSEFVKQQRLKATVLKAAQRYQEAPENMAADVERILLDGVKFQVETGDPGLFLNDTNRGLRFLDLTGADFKMGIPELDMFGIGPTRKEMLLLTGARGLGKSWGLVHIGKMCLLQRAKVAHITLENSEERTVQRYYQNMFSVAKRGDEYDQSFFEFDDLHRLTGFSTKTSTPKLHLKDPAIRRKLAAMMDEWGLRASRIVIKQFPTRKLTLAQLEAYLDGLEIVHRFVPDVLIVDYPDLMQIDSRDYRLALGRMFEGLRGLGVERNMAIVVVSQVSREGENNQAHQTGSMISEDISKIATADNVIMYGQTINERILGLARLWVEKARNDYSRFEVLITQAYPIGQFVLSSTRMNSSRYRDILRSHLGQKDDDEAK